MAHTTSPSSTSIHLTHPEWDPTTTLFFSPTRSRRGELSIHFSKSTFQSCLNPIGEELESAKLREQLSRPFNRNTPLILNSQISCTSNLTFFNALGSHCWFESSEILSLITMEFFLDWACAIVSHRAPNCALRISCRKVGWRPGIRSTMIL